MAFSDLVGVIMSAAGELVESFGWVLKTFSSEAFITSYTTVL